jgi:quinohemoprotein ethanol dehydrogenase
MRALVLAASLVLAACSGSSAPDIDTSTYGAGDDWDNPGGDWAESHFSRLTDISAENVGQLGLAWEYDLGTSRVQEATPVVIDGVMYTSGNLGRVYALNAATGEELWTFLPEVDMARFSSVRSTGCSTLSMRRPARSPGGSTRSPTGAVATRSPVRRRLPATW